MCKHRAPVSLPTPRISAGRLITLNRPVPSQARKPFKLFGKRISGSCAPIPAPHARKYQPGNARTRFARRARTRAHSARHAPRTASSVNVTSRAPGWPPPTKMQSSRFSYRCCPLYLSISRPSRFSYLSLRWSKGRHCEVLGDHSDPSPLPLQP